MKAPEKPTKKKGEIYQLTSEYDWRYLIQFDQNDFTVAPNNWDNIAPNIILQKYYIETIIPWIQKNYSKNTKILDVGCNCGWFEVELEKHGFRNIAAIDNNEINIVAANYVKSRLNLSSDFFCDTPGDLEKKDDHFDLCVCLGVLNHLRDPFSFLLSLHKIIDKTLIIDCNCYVDEIVTDGEFSFDSGPMFLKIEKGYNTTNKHEFDLAFQFSKSAFETLLQMAGFSNLMEFVKPFSMTDHYQKYRHTYICEHSSYDIESQLIEKNVYNEHPLFFIDTENPFYESIIQDRALIAFYSVDRMIKYYESYIKKTNQPVLIWGTGSYAMKFCSIIESEMIIAFVDNETNKQNKLLGGKPIISPVELSEYSHYAIAICSFLKKEIVIQILSMPVHNRIL